MWRGVARWGEGTTHPIKKKSINLGTTESDKLSGVSLSSNRIKPKESDACETGEKRDAHFISRLTFSKNAN